MAETTTATTSQVNGPSIGIVADVTGHATVTHPDGTRADITKGMQVFKGDQIETDAQGAVNITFEDNTVFAVSNNAQMTIDEFVYDADKDGQGDAEISVMRGIFVYTSGFVGKEDPSDVHIKTPAGSIGIRGTTLTGYIPPEGSGEAAKISLIEGAIVVRPVGGGEFALDTPRETVQIDTATGQGTNIGIMNATEMLDTFNVVRSVAPALFEPIANPSGVTVPNGELTPQGENNIPNADDAANIQTAETTDSEEKTASSDGTDTSATTDDGATDDTAKTDDITLTESDTLTLGDTTASVGESDSGLLSAQVGTLLGVGPAPADATMVGQLLPPPLLGAILPLPPVGPNAGDGTNFTDTNRAPVNKITSFNAIEQPGLEGKANSFNISRFLFDPDGNQLSYKITSIIDPTTALSAAGMIGSTINFNVNGAIGNDKNITVSIAAFDGKSYSGSIGFNFTLYTEALTGVSPPTLGDDTIVLPLANKRFSLLAGDDSLTINGATGNIVFGGLGNDTMIVSGSNNKAYGDSGADTLKIENVGNNNLISGGMGHDDLWIESSGTGHKIFGSDGDDVIHFETISLAALNANQTLVDGGAGFDTLILEGSGSLNLAAITNTQLHDINAIRSGSGGNSIDLDIMDIIQHTDNNRLFISASAGAGATVTVNVTNSSSLAGLTYKGDMSFNGDTFHTYSNGKQTLHIDTDIATVTGL